MQKKLSSKCERDERKDIVLLPSIEEYNRERKEKAGTVSFAKMNHLTLKC